MKKGLNININIQKKHIWFLTGLIVLLAATSLVFANWDTTKTMFHNAADVRIETLDKSLEQAVLDGDFNKTSEEDCTVWKFDNKGTNTDWKYFKFDMPYDCFPPWKTEGKTWGCTWQVSTEHHSGNSATGVWEAPRGGQFIINGPNSDGSNHYYIKIWDTSSGWQYDLQNGGADHIFWTHWHDVFRVRDSYHDGSWHEGTKASVGWNNWGVEVYPYTIAYLKICELNEVSEGATGISTRTYGG